MMKETNTIVDFTKHFAFCTHNTAYISSSVNNRLSIS